MNSRLYYYFELAAKVAIGGDIARNFWIASIGIRKDGVMVSARNGAVFSTDIHNYKTVPLAHSEFRISNKLTKDSVVYVARLSRLGGGKLDNGKMRFALSRPCRTCQSALIARGVSKVYYTIDPDSYGVIDLKTMKERQNNGTDILL